MMKYSLSAPFSCPLLLIAYRRPHCIREVIAAIRPLKPSRLYVACDGPKSGDEADQVKVAKTRMTIEQEIDWPSSIEFLYSDTNQGCSEGPIRAINWFFDLVEEGIVLEDDCIPHLDFLPYCASLLEWYRNDTRIWCISGNNFQKGQWRGNGTYYFSRYNHGWGWASWRRCWKFYDPKLTEWPKLNASGLMTTLFDDPLERAYWSEIWQQTYDDFPAITWWDYQWTFACLIHGGLTALPNRNLVTNVGFGCDATHTEGMTLDTSIHHDGIFPLLHPEFMLRDSCADSFTFDHAFDGISFRKSRTPIGRLKKQLSKAKASFRRIIYSE